MGKDKLNKRIEIDSIGKLEIDSNALYGINALRAKNNFANNSVFNLNWYKAIGTTKLACYNTAESFFKALESKYPEIIKSEKIKILDKDILKHLKEAAIELSSGLYFDSFIVPAVQGGAGTSINMNINEILSNIALEKMKEKKGNYHIVDPFEDANIFQSTNDVIPTALTIAAMKLLNELEEKINILRSGIEKLEKKFRNVKRIAYTQMQSAVPSNYGHFFSAYNDAFSRDWWRISKCFERIKVVNLGGGAIGSGAGIPNFFSMEVVNQLKKLTGLPIAKSDNLLDATSNLDRFVEVHGIIKAHAVNLEKFSSDLRLLASDISNQHFSIPSVQTGSSIMPGKINPVISEFVISCAHKTYANDNLIANLCGQGMLDLNAYLPIIGDALLNSLELLISANNTLSTNLINDININQEREEEKYFRNPSIATILVPIIGYKKASLIANEMKNQETDIFTANKKVNAINEEKLKKVFEEGSGLLSSFKISDISTD